ncbi:zona pellucida sperm-binding protein 3b isoform X2 [Brachyhypopomus gauderio]|uniref:zona pellucida sperm-binding protein 3b isoform X2 n=1 Tax=Brachyhypopomus gauderio TaxID=698409 RepID=UPI0040416780
MIKSVKKTLRCVTALISILWPVVCYPTITQESDTHLSALQRSNVNLEYNINVLNPVDQNQVEALSHRLQKIFVRCHEDSMEIVIDADLFNTGILVDARDLWLGVDCRTNKPSGPCCGAEASGTNEYTIIGNVADCRTSISVTDQTIDYTNVLIYSPAPSPDGIFFLENAVIPIKCQYIRKYKVSSSAVVPTWVPLISTDESAAEMEFDFRLMTDDWQYKRSSQVYMLGDAIHMEASVTLANHGALQVFVDSCVASPSSADGDLKYVFVDDHGCFTDGLSSASESRFLPRVQGNKLQMLLKTFIFRGDAPNLIYITCRLKAVPARYISSFQTRACSFIDERWKSADGDDQVCRSCEVYSQDLSKTDPASLSSYTKSVLTEASTPHPLLHLPPDQTLKQINEPSSSKGVSGTASEWTMTLGPLELVTKKNDSAGSSVTPLIEQVHVKPSREEWEQPESHHFSATVSPINYQVESETDSRVSMEDGSHNASDPVLPMEDDADVMAHYNTFDVALDMDSDSDGVGEKAAIFDLAVGVPTWSMGSYPPSPTESSYMKTLLSQPVLSVLHTTTVPETEMELNVVQQILNNTPEVHFYNVTQNEDQEDNELKEAPIQDNDWSTDSSPTVSSGPVYINPFSDLIPDQLPVVNEEMDWKMVEQNLNSILEDPRYNRSKLAQGSERTSMDPLVQFLNMEGALQWTDVSSTSAEQVGINPNAGHPELPDIIRASSDQSDLEADQKISNLNLQEEPVLHNSIDLLLQKDGDLE